jgi:hypothetical protein
LRRSAIFDWLAAGRPSGAIKNPATAGFFMVYRFAFELFD